MLKSSVFSWILILVNTSRMHNRLWIPEWLLNTWCVYVCFGYVVVVFVASFTNTSTKEIRGGRLMSFNMLSLISCFCSIPILNNDEFTIYICERKFWLGFGQHADFLGLYYYFGEKSPYEWGHQCSSGLFVPVLFSIGITCADPFPAVRKLIVFPVICPGKWPRRIKLVASFFDPDRRKQTARYQQPK